jgi:hypothetical protein
MVNTRKAAETFTRNAFETTLSSTFGASDTTATVASTSGLTSPCYLVIEPDSSTQREYVFFDGTFTGTQLVTTTADNRYLTGSAAASGLSHPQNSKVRMVPVQQLFEDIFDALGQVVDVSYASGTAGTPKLAANLDANNNKITNLTTPAAGTDAANKTYADGAANPNSQTDGTGITVDLAADFLILYDNDTTNVVKVNPNQISTPQEVHPFLIMGG